ncbi:hypothetical protein N325_10870, partial [Colius striatus]
WVTLAQGHDCEDFEGMCCMNFGDHSESIHKSIQDLKDLTKQLKVIDCNPFLGLNWWSGL